MKGKILLIFMVSILFFQGCAKTQIVKISAFASRDQKTAYDGTIISRKKHLVSLSPYAELGSVVFDLSKYKTIFMLSVENCGKEPISIGFDNIAVIFVGKSKDLASKNINLQSFDDFIRDFEKLYNDNEKAFIYNTIYNYYSLWISSQLLSNQFTPVGSIRQEPVIDEERLTNRMYIFREEIKEGRTKKDMIQETLPGLILKQKTIIKPGNSYSGIVICDTHDLDPQKEGSFLIIVSVDSEEHQFTFRRAISK